MLGKAALRTVAMLGATALALPAGAQEGETVSAEEILKEMSTALASAMVFTVSIEKTFDDVLVNGHKIQLSGALDLAVHRPDRLYVSYGDDLSAKEVWFDGSAMVMLDHRDGLVGRLPVDGSLDDAIDAVAETHGVVLPLGELISTDLYEKIEGSLLEIEYIGLHDVGGRPAHHLLLIGPLRDAQIWVDAGETPLPLKMVITDVDEPTQPQQSFVFSDWTLSDALSDEVFEAEVPEGYLNVVFLPRE